MANKHEMEVILTIWKMSIKTTIFTKLSTVSQKSGGRPFQAEGRACAKYMIYNIYYLYIIIHIIYTTYIAVYNALYNITYKILYIIYKLCKYIHTSICVSV